MAKQPQPRLEYVLRYTPFGGKGETERHKKASLSGYGVALDLKKTDYLVVDDRRSASKGKVYKLQSLIA